jgi:hypothetical protein
MTTKIIKQFNEIVSSFLIQVTPLVGTTYKFYFDKLIQYNAILPIEQFLVHALPLRDKILERDESYFINSDHSNTPQVLNNEYTLSEILRLQNIFGQLDTDSRSNVWDIFQAMLYLGEEYVKLKVGVNV